MTQPSSGTQLVSMLPTRVLGLPQSIEIDCRLDKKLRQGCIGVPAAAEGSENKQQNPLLAYSLRNDTLFLIWGEAGGVSRGQAGGKASVVCLRLRWWCV